MQFFASLVVLERLVIYQLSHLADPRDWLFKSKHPSQTDTDYQGRSRHWMFAKGWALPAVRGGGCLRGLPLMWDKRQALALTVRAPAFAVTSEGAICHWLMSLDLESVFHFLLWKPRTQTQGLSCSDINFIAYSVSLFFEKSDTLLPPPLFGFWTCWKVKQGERKSCLSWSHLRVPHTDRCNLSPKSFF